MTPSQFRAALDAIGWSQHQLARRLGINDSTARRWASGRTPIPTNVAEWLLALRRMHSAIPHPIGWTTHEEDETP